MAVTLASVLRSHASETINVPFNRAAIALWPPETTIQYLVTAHLNACTGVVIVSPKAGILAHIAPVPPGTQQNVTNLLRTIQALYTTHRDKFDSIETYVVAAIFEGQPAMPEGIRMIDAFLRGVGLRVTWRGYPVLDHNQARPEGYTSIVVHAYAQGVMPKVYVNGTQLNSKYCAIGPGGRAVQ